MQLNFFFQLPIKLHIYDLDKLFHIQMRPTLKLATFNLFQVHCVIVFCQKACAYLWLLNKSQTTLATQVFIYLEKKMPSLFCFIYGGVHVAPRCKLHPALTIIV
jgi:hypothetical protein